MIHPLLDLRQKGIRQVHLLSAFDTTTGVVLAYVQIAVKSNEIAVKANQPTLFTQLKHLPWARVPVGDRRRDTGHGRRETRTVKAA